MRHWKNSSRSKRKRRKELKAEKEETQAPISASVDAALSFIEVRSYRRAGEEIRADDRDQTG